MTAREYCAMMWKWYGVDGFRHNFVGVLIRGRIMIADTPANRRRSTRLTIAIPIFISGADALGQEFRESAHTLVVNKHGAKIVTSHKLAIGTEIMIENPAVGGAAKAVVLALGAPNGPADLPEVIVQLFEAQNIWGIDFPPEDWG